MTGRCFILKNTPIPLAVLVCSITLLCACGHKAEPVNAGNATFMAAYKSSNNETEDVAAVAVSDAGNGSGEDYIDANAGVVSTVQSPPHVIADGKLVAIPKKIIKSGTIRYSVNDYNNAHKKLAEVVARYRGDITGENEQRSELSWETRMEIKVPAEKFDSCLEAISGNAQTLIEKTVSSEDKTAEYVDVAARMKAKKEVELRYLDILKQAKSVKDILEVEEQLKGIREEVEASQARLQYIDQNVAMSTIHLSFYQAFANTSPQGPGFFSRIFFSIKDGWNNVLSFLIDLVGMWPGILVLTAAVIFIRRYIKRRRQRKAMAV